MNKRIIYTLTAILLLATHFFRLAALPAHRLIVYGMYVFMLVSAFKYYDKRVAIEKFIVLYALGCAVSYLYSVFVNEQPIELLLLSYEPYFGLLFYFVVKRYHPSADTIRKVILIVSFLAVICYLIQWTVYPRILFAAAASDTDVNDTQFRMRFVCTLSFMLIWFYGLNKYFVKSDRKALVWSFLGIIPQIVMGFRSLLGLLAAGTILIGFFCSKKLQHYIKYGVLIAAITYGALQVPLVQEKIEEMSERQETDTFSNSDYVRVLGMAFYEDYFEEDKIMRVVGGGIPLIGSEGPNSTSNAYQRDMYQADAMGLKWNDLGLVGLSYMIGTPTVLLLVLLCIICIWQCKAKEIQWVRFAVAVSMLGTILTSAELYRFGNLLLLGALLYYVRIYNCETINRK